jgi:hypothetical protein
MIDGADNGSFILVTFALVPEVREAMKTRYAQLVADFPFDKDVITSFEEWDMLMCKFEDMFKEIATRSLALKHALWKGDLWLVDDLADDNYFSALTLGPILKLSVTRCAPSVQRTRTSAGTPRTTDRR